MKKTLIAMLACCLILCTGCKKEDLLNILNTSVINDIANESKYNAYGWIQPKYYYDSTNDVYVTVKTMLILP